MRYFGQHKYASVFKRIVCSASVGTMIIGAVAIVAVAAEISPGQSRADVIAALGQPKGQLSSHDEEILLFSDRTVFIQQDRVVRVEAVKPSPAPVPALPASPEPAPPAPPPEPIRAPAPPPARAAAPASGQAKVKTVGQGGKRIDLEQILVPGNITVVDFYADWCGPCRQISPHLDRLAQQSDVYVRKVDIVNWKTPVVSQYKINSVPNVRVYDSRGRMVGEPTSDMRKITGFVAQARK